MECLPVARIPEGVEWIYEILCGGPHKISSVVKVIMWCWIIRAATFASEVVLQRNIIGNLLNTLNSATHNSPILPSETDALHEKLYQAFVSYLDAAQAHLGYWDFLYFSVGAATTATFGDIASNSSSVRMLVCLQVLGSIVFSGLMINGLADAKSLLVRRVSGGCPAVRAAFEGVDQRTLVLHPGASYFRAVPHGATREEGGSNPVRRADVSDRTC